MRRVISIIVCLSSVFALFSFNAGMRLGLDWYVVDEDPDFFTHVGNNTYYDSLVVKSNIDDYLPINGSLFGQTVIILGYVLNDDYLILKAYPTRVGFTSEHFIQFTANIDSVETVTIDGQSYNIYSFSGLRRRLSFMDNLEVVNTLVTVYNEARVSLEEIDNIVDFFEFIYVNIRETYRLFVSLVLFFSSGGTYI